MLFRVFCGPCRQEPHKCTEARNIAEQESAMMLHDSTAINTKLGAVRTTPSLSILILPAALSSENVNNVLGRELDYFRDNVVAVRLGFHLIHLGESRAPVGLIQFEIERQFVLRLHIR